MKLIFCIPNILLLRVLAHLLSISVLLVSFSVIAVPVFFTGTLIDNPPCSVNNAEPLDVPFGEVGITKIDGVNYAQSFTLNLNCNASLGGETVLFLEYDGISADYFDVGALQTNRYGLGIRLYHSSDSALFPINSGHAIMMTGGSASSLNLYAVPVKAPGVDLPEGEFTATATFELQYP